MDVLRHLPPNVFRLTGHGREARIDIAESSARMEELYDPTENNAIGADATLSETDEIFTQDILSPPRENTSEPSTSFVSDLGLVHPSGMWWRVLDDTAPWSEPNPLSPLPLTRSAMMGLDPGLDPGLDWTREQGEPEQEQGRDLAQGQDTFRSGDRDREGERGSSPLTDSSSFSNSSDCGPALSGNSEDEQQGSQSRRSLTSSPLPIVGSSIFCGSSLFSTQVSTPVSGTSRSYDSVPNPGCFSNPVPPIQTYFSSTSSSTGVHTSRRSSTLYSSTSSTSSASRSSSRTGPFSGISPEVQELVIDIDSDDECGGDDEGEEGEEFGLFAEVERDVDVYTQDVGPGDQPLLTTSGQEVSMQGWGVGASSVTSPPLRRCSSEPQPALSHFSPLRPSSPEDTFLDTVASTRTDESVEDYDLSLSSSVCVISPSTLVDNTKDSPSSRQKSYSNTVTGTTPSLIVSTSTSVSAPCGHSSPSVLRRNASFVTDGRGRVVAACDTVEEYES